MFPSSLSERRSDYEYLDEWIGKFGPDIAGKKNCRPPFFVEFRQMRKTDSVNVD